MKEFFEKLETLSSAFDDPEYLFLVLEPLQTWGVAFGLIGLVVTYFLKNEKLQVASLIVIAVSALSVIPYLGARTAAETRIEKVYVVSARPGPRASRPTPSTALSIAGSTSPSPGSPEPPSSSVPAAIGSASASPSGASPSRFTRSTTACGCTTRIPSPTTRISSGTRHR